MLRNPLPDQPQPRRDSAAPSTPDSPTITPAIPDGEPIPRNPPPVRPANRPQSQSDPAVPSTPDSSTIAPASPDGEPITHSQDTPQVNLPRNTAPPSFSQPNELPQPVRPTAQPRGRKELVEDRERKMNSFIEEVRPLTGRMLSDEEWKHFEGMTDQLASDLKEMIDREPRRHHTSNWKKRQRRRWRPQHQANSSSSRRSQSQSQENQQAQPQPQENPPPPSPHPPSQTEPQSSAQQQPTRQCQHRRSGRQARAQEASKLQRWYRGNKKRCIRHILDNESSPFCEIPLKDLESHFTEDPSIASATAPPPPDFLPQSENSSDPDDLTAPITPEEVKQQLKRLPTQSSPGPDGVPYFVWKSASCASPLLAMVYSTCCLNQRVPQSWKESNTILIFKKGDRSTPRNWRPISLQPTIYKVYAAVLARRLASWALANNKITQCQKGFLPYEGCAEHSFLLRSVLEDSKRRRKDVRIVWLDLRNAFGSIPHSTMWDMMNRLDVPASLTSICKEIYHNSTQRVRSKEGYTSPISVTRGIKQGCPLSPLLFNLVLEGILPHLERSDDGYKFQGGGTLRALAYADDLCVIGSTKEGVNHMLEQVHQFLQWSGLAVNPSKCGSLSAINSGSRKYVEPFQPAMGPETLPALKWEDHYKYLGIQVGRQRLGSLRELEETIVKEAETICSSGLADWQKLEATNMFVLSKASYYFNASIVDKTWATRVDAAVRRAVKKAMRLPKRALSSFLYASRAHGGLGLTSLEDSLDSSSIVRVLRCLSSRDKLVQDVAWSQLSAVVRKRTGKDQISDADVQNFFNSAPCRNEARRGDIRSGWSAVRKSLSRLGCRIEVSGMQLQLIYDEASADARQRSAVARLLSKAKSTLRLSLIQSAPDQGRVFHHTSKHPSSNHWIQSGAFTSFAEYRFAMKGRLNLLPTKSVAKRAGKPDLVTTCPKCRHEPETLGHVLNACTPSMGLMRERHNMVLQRLVRAVPASLGDKFVEQKIKDSPGCAKPDLVVLNQSKKSAVIVDVTVPFEGDEEAFSTARGEKVRKYTPLKDWLASQGYSKVALHAFIVGSLGSWDPENEDALRSLNIGQSYARLFRKLCVSDAIKGSLALWKAKG